MTSFAHGMTVATNALLEERGARTALLTTEGFTDVLELARQTRPELYRPCRAGPAPLVPAELRLAVAERCGPGGCCEPLDERRLADTVRRLRDARVDSVADLPAPLLRAPGPRAPRRPGRAGRPAGRPRLGLARARERVPRVRAHVHHGDRRLPVAVAARLSRAPRRAGRRGRTARAGDHALERRADERRARPGGTPPGPCCRDRPRARSARRTRAACPGTTTCSRSTWAAPPATWP